MKLFSIILFVFYSCQEASIKIPDQSDTTAIVKDKMAIAIIDTHPVQSAHYINTGTTTPGELLTYAKSLTGTPYKYGSVNPANGFDCSGFITHVFNHFNIAVPRSSIDFTDVQRAIDIKEAKPGDIILFTGTDSTIKHVGHMGIITANNNNLVEFIHSTSGKAYGVTITPLNKYYIGRFVKVIRVFKQNDQS